MFGFIKNMIYLTIFAFVLGIIVTSFFMWSLAPKLMLLEDESLYEFDDTVEKFTKAVEDNGWKLVVVHDLQKTMDEFGKDVLKAKVFEICHPEHAYEILKESDERIVTSLMPCRVSIYEKDDGKVYVSRLNSGLMGRMMSGVVPKVMGKASKESEKIVKTVIK